MGRPIKKGSTDQSTVIRIIDSTDGTPETGVEHNSAGIDLWWRREQETKTVIVEAALAALDSAHSDGGIEHIADGYYRLDLPDAAVAAGAGENSVQIGGTLTGMIVIGNEHALVDYDPYDSVRAGLTALPNAAPDAAGGLPISDDGGLDMDSILEKMLAYVRLLARSDAAVETDAATELTAINADEASGAGNFSSQTDAVEAIRDVAPHGSAMVGTNSANTTVPDAAGTAGGLHTTTDALLATIAAYLDTEVAAIVAAVITNAAGTDIAADIIALKGETASIQAETTAIKAIVDWFRSASGTVVVNNPGTDTIFDLTAVVGTLSADAAAFKNMEITIFDNSGSVYQTRKISTWDGPNLRATLDAALTFPVQNGVDTFVLWNKYSPTAAAGSGATVAEIMAAALAGYTTEGTAGNALRQLRHYF